MSRVIIDLFIPAEEYISLYNGTAKDVFCHARDGRSIRFPGNILQPFITHDGINGTFCINFDQEGKFLSITQMA